MLFGDRVDAGSLSLSAGVVPLTLAAGTGLDEVCKAANRSGMTVTGLPPAA